VSAYEQPTAVTIVRERQAPGLRASVRDPAWQRTALGGAALVAALAAAQAGASASVPLGLAAVGTVFACAVLAPAAARGVRRSPAVLVAGLLLLLLVGAGGFFVFGFGTGGVTLDGYSPLYLPLGFGELVLFVLVALAGLAGFVLLADALRVRRRLGVSGWRRLSTGTTPARVGFPWSLLAGIALVGLAGALTLVLLGPYVDGGSLLLLLLLGVLGAGAVAVGTPLLVGGLARAEETQADGSLQEERQRIAAHLHDSVLQTLALVQRQADDPQAVARLARRQEHALRAWMAGDTELGSDTLAGVLRDVVAEVEDEHGLAVEVSLIGDRPVDAGGEALAGALREALRNAARHAPVSPVFVFCEISPDRAEAFVRDEGPGFVLGAVPRERRGVRDSIVGRMAAVGGHASVESVVGEGTEVVLRIGAPR